ncbi:MAG TPA: b(o/a)3-type cytochrome-c oxidase subunit 1 [Methylococcaceae bacterium]|nr:b(o/a)3-type cytochrome-c oxidase subunit 1 [Methylococcaceae bacterium]
MDNEVKKLALTHFWVSFGSFGLACVLGVYQVLERSGFIPAIQSPEVYFASVSTHGVLMAFVLTTFFVMGFGYVVAVSSLKTPLWSPKLAWTGFWISAVGVVLAAIPLLIGKASVLYTFYPPVQANLLFYIGAALLVVGSWFWAVIMIVMFAGWKNAHPGETVPLPMFATTANAVLWLWTSVGVALEVVFQLIPWALGLTDSIDPGLARTLFAWTLHPIVYFWLLPAYIALYSFVPRAAGGKLFSHGLARAAFVMLLVLALPIGFHHLYMDPEQGAGYKLSHAVGTFLVALPTLVTGFTVVASMEMAGRARGGAGLFGWIGALPWRNPVVLAAILAFLMLIAGGFGGIVNASYAMNAMVHNTAWVPGHFHLMFGGTTVMLYMAVAYHVWPKLTGRAFASADKPLIQLWSWFIGMVVLSSPWHILGLLGQPRRISSVTYNSLLTLAWDPYELVMIIGGFILLFSGLLFLHILGKAQRQGAPQKDDEIEYAEYRDAQPAVHPLLNGFAVWNVLIFGLMLANYGQPIAQFFLNQTFGSVAWGY